MLGVVARLPDQGNAVAVPVKVEEVRGDKEEERGTNENGDDLCFS